MTVAGYETHPAADVFPMMTEDELRELAADIRTHGLRQAVVMVGERILDGRNRVSACALIGMEPRFRQYEGPNDEADLLDYVVSQNFARRHLTASQRAWLGAKLEERYAEIAKEAQRQGGRRGGKGSKDGANLPQGAEQRPRAPRARDRAAQATGASARTVQDAKLVRERGAPEVHRAVELGDLTVAAAKELAKIEDHETQREILEKSSGKPGNIRSHVRAHTRRELAKSLEAEPVPTPKGPFRVIVADPPWRYDLRSSDRTHRGETPYPQMSTEAICDLPIRALAHDDAVLWLWTTNGHLLGGDALRVATAWGFEPKSLLTWVKDRLGLGNYLRGKTEHCILAIRGNPVLTFESQSTELRGHVREHSRKPESFYELVEATSPGSKVELFSRSPRPGWEAWGAEVDMFQETGAGA